MVTEYGKFLRKLRIDKNERLEDMAKKLDISKSYLSLIENGNREVRSEFSAKIANVYKLTQSQCKELIKAASMTPVKTITIDLEALKNNQEAKSTAELFANILPRLTQLQTNDLYDLIYKFACKNGVEDQLIGDFS